MVNVVDGESTSKFVDLVIGSRSSIRRFKQDPIPDEIVTKILWAGTRAPTAGGRENWYFIVVRDEVIRRKIHELLTEAHLKYAMDIVKMSSEKVFKWRKLMEEGMYLAPTYIAVYMKVNDWLEGFEYLMDLQSAAAAIENMILAAWSFGIGSVWLGVPLLIEDKFNDVLKPPNGYRLISILALGYPAESVRTRPRKPLEAVTKFI